MPDATEVDYLVIGAGAAGLGFTDVLVAETDATVLVVDRRHGPGGHWNDAYPFVRLHQPSAFYGVNSLNLGEDRIDDSGPNAGFYERATAAEIVHYFQTVMANLLASGQVEFALMTSCEESGDGRVTLVSLLTGATREVTVRRKIVDARYVETTIPANHTPGFVVDDDADCIPVNALVKRDEPAGGYVVLGTGKTGMDACVWLLEQGVDSDRITWVKPREAWTLDRATLQPCEKVGDFIISYAASIEACAKAESIPDLFARLEACGTLQRLDPTIEPTMFRAAITSEYERERQRTIEHVIRAGRVRRLQRDRIVLEDAEVPMPAGSLYVDCTAAGLGSPPTRPIFEADRVRVQPVREGSPTFNAAVIAFIETARDDPAEQNALAQPKAYPSTAVDWIHARHHSLLAQMTWDATPDVAAWIEASRLNIARGLFGHASDPGVGAALGTYLEHVGPSIENLGRFRAEPGASA